MRHGKERYRCPDPTGRGDLTDVQLELCKRYLKNDSRELIAIVYSVIKNYGVGSATRDVFDDYLSLANQELWRAARNYSSEKCDNFHAYLVFRISNKMKQQLRDSNRFCRMQSIEVKGEDGEVTHIRVFPKSLDAESEKTGKSFAEIIGATDDAIEHFFEENQDDEFSNQMQQYLHTLTKKQRDILHMVENGMPAYQIQEKLGISEAMYNFLWEDMTSIEKTKGLESLFCVRF